MGSSGASSGPGSRPADHAPSGHGAPRFDPSRDDDHDPSRDYEDDDCWNCGGEGYVYGCSWDWQCDTYDEGEGTCLCTRPCDVCQPRPRNAELDAVLAAALRDSDQSGAAGQTPQAAGPEGRERGPEGHRPTSATILTQDTGGEKL